MGTCLFTDFILKKMIKNKKGNIINVASTYSIVSPNMNLYRGTNTFKLNKPIEYIITKSFIPNYSRYIATTYIKNGIRCNTVVPHAVIKNDKNNIFQKRIFQNYHHFGRFCKPSELNGLFIFLSSDSSSYFEWLNNNYRWRLDCMVKKMNLIQRIYFMKNLSQVDY